jgi:hypothetical protein
LVEHWEGLFEASFAVTQARESLSYLLVEHCECLFEAPFAVTQARESVSYLLVGGPAFFTADIALEKIEMSSHMPGIEPRFFVFPVCSVGTVLTAVPAPVAV